ncbi:LysR family transcriptional regulator [Sedimenticola sp.]|uniref:LysR family transcriptional regulator n=1 Tax=Sedimenticola sp. TaxID=1940285 RepID=UPI003D12FF6E
MLNLDEVLTFQAVASSGNFTVAADQLHVTQSTISHQIRRLEERLGQKLFLRTTRSVKLTLAGERFLPYAEKLIETSKAAEQSIAMETITGEVRIGVPEEFAYSHLVDLLSRFRLHYPNVALAIEVGTGIVLTEKLGAGGLDIALVKEAPATKAAVRQEPLVWVGRKSLLESPSLPFAFYPGPCAFRKVAIEAMERQGRAYSVILISASLEALRIAAAAGAVITVTPQSQCPASLLLPTGGTALPALPSMGYRIQLEETPAKPVVIAAEIIGELLSRRIEYGTALRTQPESWAV